MLNKQNLKFKNNKIRKNNMMEIKKIKIIWNKNS